MKADIQAEFKCPSCGAACHAGYADHPDNGEKGAPMVMHAQPYCQYFLKTDVLKIVQDANAKRG